MIKTPYEESTPKFKNRFPLSRKYKELSKSFIIIFSNKPQTDVKLTLNRKSSGHEKLC